jgi:putative rhamnosyltransferase
MTPRMLVATRFGLGIEDPAWFEHRLILLSAITAPSLLSQEDQNFEWVLRVDSKFLDSIRGELAEILSPFEGRAHICPNHHRALLNLAEERDLVGRQGHLLVGRIDDDDAWERHTVGEVRERVGNWEAERPDARGYGLTFESGLVWMMYDMIELDQSRRKGAKVICKAAVRSYRYPFTSISGYTYSTASHALNVLATGHAEVPDLMKDRGYTIDVIGTDHPMWLYCRHKQADSSAERGEGPDLDRSVADLEAMFGIDGTQTRRYIASQNQYGYCNVMQKFDLRGKLVREMRDIDRRRSMLDLDAEEAARLNEMRGRVSVELKELAETVISSPGVDPQGEAIPSD